jgi:hypothetical protein
MADAQIERRVMPSKRPWVRHGITSYWALLAVILFLSALWIPIFPIVAVDEANQINAIWTWWRGTHATESINRIYDPVPTWNGGVFGIAAAALFAVVGPSIWAARLLTFVTGLVLLAVTYGVGKRLYGAATARVATILLALSWSFWFSSHLFRQDTAVAALGMAALFLVLAPLGRLDWLMHASAGLLLGLGFDVHPNITGFWAGIALVLLARYRLALWRSPQAWALVMGIALGLGVTLGMLAPAGLEARTASANVTLQSDKQPPVLVYSPAQMLAAESLRYVALLRESPIDVLLIVVAVAWTLVRRDATDRPLLLLLFGLTVFFLAFVQTKYAYYVIIWYPIVVLLLAHRVVDLAQRAPVSSGPANLLAVAAFPCVLLAANRLTHQMLPSAAQRPMSWSLALQTAIPAGASVVGEPVYWLALQDHPYTSWWALSWLWRRDGRTPGDVFKDQPPEAIIVDDFVEVGFQPVISDSPFWQPIWERTSRPFPFPGSLSELLVGRYRLAFDGTFDDRGRVRVYLRADAAD